MRYPTYLQYDVLVQWTYLDGAGRRRTNGTGFTKMYPGDAPGVESVERWAREEWWPTYKGKGAEPSAPEITVTILGEESWCLGWFSHWTFDVGQTDAEALASFEEYVRRYEDRQDYWPGDPPEGYRCLMGAEDRWRWCGGPSADKRTPPPCRCKHCREQGVIRINH